MTAAPVLDELERDALTEVVNIGVSRAAVSLRQMVGRQVLLSVPSIEIVSQRAAATLIGEREAGDLVAVRQSFAGAFCGKALLIFPAANSLDLVRAVVGEAIGDAEALDMREEALAETGNVILNGCLATMANMLRQKLDMSLPEVIHGGSTHLFEIEPPTGDDGMALFLYINFAVKDRDLHGYIAMLMDLPSLSALKSLIADFIARVMDDHPVNAEQDDPSRFAPTHG